MVSKTKRLAVAALVGLCVTGTTYAQPFPELVTDFETDREGTLLNFQPATYDDLSVVVFQDPAEGDVTLANILPDASAIVGPLPDLLPSTEESFVANFLGVGFQGANASAQSLDIRFQWANSNGTRWALVETLQSPMLGDPSVHLGGKIRMYVNFPNCSFEFPTLTYQTTVGIALLISETGRDVPQGFQDNDVLLGNFEFVGVSAVLNSNGPDPVPIPTTFLAVTDPDCTGTTTGPAGDWRLLEFDLAALSTTETIGWGFRGGDGVLDATTNGDGVNRGVLAGLVLTVQQSDVTSDYLEILVDGIEFEAPVIDSASPPAIGSPVIENDVTVRINQVLSRATNVVLEIDRSDADNEDPFVADDTFAQAPGLNPATEPRFTDIAVTPALAAGDRLRARQEIGADISTNSIEVPVNPPAAFSATLSLDEDGTLGSVAVFEWVGAASVSGGAPQGKPVFVQNGVWQKLEYSLIPGVEPVIDFAGGNGQLQPNGGLYNIDAMFFTIDPTAPSTGPYDIFIDHIFVTDVNDNEIIISDAEATNPFPNFRGQSTSTNNTSILSGVASYDGSLSNRIGWQFPDLAPSNTCAPYRPLVTFADSAKAVGMWLLVEDARTNGLPLPAVNGPVVGDAPAVTVSNISTNAITVELLVNGNPAGSTPAAGAVTVDVVPTVALAVGDSISARYTATTSNGLSDLAYARAVIPPAPPVTEGPLVEGMTAVTVSGLLAVPNATASLVTLFDGTTPIDSVDPAGATSVVFSLTQALVAGQQISASQTVNTVESAKSAPVGVGTGVTVCVVINEFQYDDSGVDDREFVEIYNAEAGPVDISNWQLRASDTLGPGLDNNADYTIPPGTILAAGDYYVVGDPLVPNVDLGIAGGNLWENANEAIELLDSNGVRVDTVVYELNKGPVAISPAEGGIWANFVSIDATPQSWSRWLDGLDTDNNGRDFGLRPITPGLTNDVASLGAFTDTFDIGAVGSAVTNWLGSFVNLVYIDPTTVSPNNLNAIPASTQGGQAATCWDPAGGGNMCALTDEARYNIGFSCEVYIDATSNAFNSNGLADEAEGWSIGLGTVGGFHNLFAGNGNTGLAWEFLKTEDGNTGKLGSISMQLVNENDGGDDGVVLLDVPATALTTGWHTIGITRNYENYSASFDAIATNGVAAGNSPSNVFVGYREFASFVPAALRPPTIDNLSITVPALPTLGACCTDCGCRLLTQAECAAAGGSYAGDATDCTDGDASGLADACEALASPAPTVASPLCDGGVLVMVSGIVPEASVVTVYEGGVNPLGTATPGGAAAVGVHMSPPLSAGQAITATQTVAGFESALSNEVTVAVCPDAFCVTLFSDDFDTDSSAAWTVNTSGADTAYTFAYDYSADGIPPSPNGAGTTLGLKMEANLAAPAAAEYLAATPTGFSASGNYRLTFDFWINYELGIFTSTEFIGGGVGYDGVSAQQSGAMFLGTGDGGSGRDYRLYKDTDEQLLNNPVEAPQFTVTSHNNTAADYVAAFPGQTPPAAQGQIPGSAPNGTLAFGWHTMTITVDGGLQTANFKIDSLNLGTLVCGGELGPVCATSGAVQAVYADIFSSVADTPALAFGVIDNFKVVSEQPAGISLGDWDGDGDTDIDDYAGFAECMGGPDSPPASAGCAAECLSAFDYNTDNDVDLGDFVVFQTQF